MCGFVGFSSKTKNKEKVIRTMADTIVHRGPDSDGYFVEDVVALGFRRLSIIDLEGGTQPIYSADESKLIIFNGEIYNYQDIKKELIEKGYEFKTDSDTEVILHAYEEYGVDSFSKLRGMFAFVIYDRKSKELVGARDFFGIKPMYYYHDKNTFLFGSEIKSFLPHPEFKKELNKEALQMYLVFQYSVHDETFFKNVFKLKPGHYFTYKDGRLEIKEYFKVSYQKQEKSYDYYKEHMSSVLKDSIAYHQISDVEVGAYLSGGVDSSYVAAVAKPNKTFSVGFEQKGFDETVHAKELSEMLGIENYSTYVSADQFFDAMPTIQYHTDEPHANLSTVPLYFLSKMAAEHVKVVLSGEGADEMFAGYDDYYESGFEQQYKKLPLSIKKIVGNLSSKMPYFKGRELLKKLATPIEKRYIGPSFVMKPEEANNILKQDYQQNKGIEELIHPYYKEVENQDDVTKKIYLDMHYWLPQDILLKADKMSMASSLELRVPFLDRVVFEESAKIPNKYLIKNGLTKYLFRDLAHDALPEQWAKRKKLGFPVPFSKWIQEDNYYNKVKKMFQSKFTKEFFEQDKIMNWLTEHKEGIHNHGRKIYNVYVFLVWYQRYFIEQ